MAVIKIPDGKGGWIKLPTVKGDPGEDANVTKENVELALGFTPKDYKAGDNIAIADDIISVTGQLGLTEEEVKAVKVDSAKDADTVSGYTVAKNIPADAKLTDTIVDVSGKVDKIAGKGLSSNDYTTVEKNKLSGIEAAANNYQLPSTLPYSMLTGTPSIPTVTNLLKKNGDTLESYTEKVVNTSGTINLANGNVFVDTPSANRTYTITGAKSGVAHSFTLQINMNTVRTLTFPTSVKWQDGVIPDLTKPNKTYILTFMTTDGGNNWLGMFGGAF